MRLIWLSALLLLSTQGGAAFYECEKNGAKVYQDKPCPSNSQTVRTIADSKHKGLPWNSLRLGMSKNEVVKALPNAIAGDGDRLFNGATALLVIEQLDVAGVQFVAKFFFEDSRLTRINLSSGSADNATVAKRFAQVLKEFQRRYGQGRVQYKEQSGLAHQAEWQDKAGRVWASCIPITADSALFNAGIVFAQ